MNSVIILAMAIIIAAVIVVLGYGYIVGNPQTFRTTSVSTSTITTTSTSTSTSITSTTTIPYVSIESIVNNSYSVDAEEWNGSGWQYPTFVFHVNGTLAWEALNKTEGYYVVTSNVTTHGKGGYNDSLTLSNNKDAVQLTGITCNADSRSGFTCSPTNYTNQWSSLVVINGSDYTFTGTLIQGTTLYILKVTNVQGSNT